MRRKVVLHGPSTLTISLPREWVRKFEIKKGDELDVEERGNEIYINAGQTFNQGGKVIEIKNLNRLGKSQITSSCRQGYEEIEINYEDPSYIETIQAILSREITGFEIIKQRNNSCVSDILPTLKVLASLESPSASGASVVKFNQSRQFHDVYPDFSHIH